MYKILLVDDQKTIRYGLKHMLGQMNLPISQVYLASDGLEASEFITKFEPDIVIADIRMPNMDGLELMEEVKARGIQAAFIIVSGYDDFSYAQKAIELGAKAYLLKPVERSELSSRLEQIMKELSERRSLDSIERELNKQTEEAKRRELLFYLKGGSINESLIFNVKKEFSNLWSHYRLYIFRSSYIRVENKKINRNNPALPSYFLVSALEEACAEVDYFLLDDTNHVMAAISASLDPMHLSRKLHEKTIFSCSLVSEEYHSFDAILDAYNEVNLLFKHSYLFPEKASLQSEDLEVLSDQWVLPWDDIHTLFKLLGTESPQTVTEHFSNLFRKEKLRQFHVDYYVELAKAVVLQMEEYERVILPWVGQDKLDLLSLRQPFAYASVHSYLEAVLQQLLHLNYKYQEMSFTYESTDIINEAVRYIQQHYDKPIDLSEVAEHVHLNYTYFSSLFKKKLGKSFSEYLRDVRIDQSKLFLVSSDETINEVAKRVGFDSYRSFNRSFLDVTGMQASEYRKQYSDFSSKWR